ncbi:hypothetical protein ACX0G9_30950 [Flavitalea flava]
MSINTFPVHKITYKGYELQVFMQASISKRQSTGYKDVRGKHNKPLSGFQKAIFRFLEKRLFYRPAEINKRFASTIFFLKKIFSILLKGHFYLLIHLFSIH